MIESLSLPGSPLARPEPTLGPTYCGTIGQAIIIDANTAVWVLDAVQQLHELSRLPRGWDSYGGKPIQPIIRAHAGRLFQALEYQDLPTPHVGLGPRGTVQLEWDADGKGLELEILDGENLGFLQINADGSTQEGKMASKTRGSLERLTSLLLDLRRP